IAGRAVARIRRRRWRRSTRPRPIGTPACRAARPIVMWSPPRAPAATARPPMRPAPRPSSVGQQTIRSARSCLAWGAEGRIDPACRGGIWARDLLDTRSLLRMLIKIEAGRTNSRNYRLLLPVFGAQEGGQTQGRTVVGSETIGKLPNAEVRRLSSVRKVEYEENS